MKFEQCLGVGLVLESPSTRRAWIEITTGESSGYAADVALHTEGVD